MSRTPSRKPGVGSSERHGADLVTVHFESPLDGADVVEAGDDHVANDGAGDAAALGFERTAVPDDRDVMAAVVAAREDESLLAVRVGAGEADRMHRGLCASGGEADDIDAAGHVDEHLGQVYGRSVDGVVGGALLELVSDG
jgi:hypothetical protein